MVSRMTPTQIYGHALVAAQRILTGTTSALYVVRQNKVHSDGRVLP